MFVATDTYLSRQAYFCCDKTFVATKIILVAALANDRNYHLVSVIYRPWYHYCFDPSKGEDNTAALGSLKSALFAERFECCGLSGALNNVTGRLIN